VKKYVLIVAAGKGTRFNAETPKQFALVNNKPLLLHTFDAFLKASKDYHYVLVLSESMIPFWSDICHQYKFIINHQIVAGGSTRLQSVKNGLENISEDVLVAIHDGVRPHVSKRLIEEGFALADKSGSAIPVVKITDSVREIKITNSKPVSRNNLVLVQTPQFFQSSLIKEAYRSTIQTNFTDDATVYEQSGHAVTLFEGDRRNVKVTFEEDLSIVGSTLPD